MRKQGLGFYLKGEENGEGGEHEDGQITLPHDFCEWMNQRIIAGKEGEGRGTPQCVLRCVVSVVVFPYSTFNSEPLLDFWRLL